VNHHRLANSDHGLGRTTPGVRQIGRWAEACCGQVWTPRTRLRIRRLAVRIPPTARQHKASTPAGPVHRGVASRPSDGPDTYTAGTLSRRSSKKVARAVNVARGNHPLVVLANLSGGGGRPRQRRRQPYVGRRPRRGGGGPAGRSRRRCVEARFPRRSARLLRSAGLRPPLRRRCG
jgi:hypothetical protein